MSQYPGLQIRFYSKFSCTSEFFCTYYFALSFCLSLYFVCVVICFICVCIAILFAQVIAKSNIPIGLPLSF